MNVKHEGKSDCSVTVKLMWLGFIRCMNYITSVSFETTFQLDCQQFGNKFLTSLTFCSQLPHNLSEVWFQT